LVEVLVEVLVVWRGTMVTEVVAAAGLVKLLEAVDADVLMLLELAYGFACAWTCGRASRAVMKGRRGRRTWAEMATMAAVFSGLVFGRGLLEEIGTGARCKDGDRSTISREVD